MSVRRQRGDGNVGDVVRLDEWFRRIAGRERDAESPARELPDVPPERRRAELVASSGSAR